MFSDEEFKHWFLPQEGIIDAYVVVKDNNITGIIVPIFIIFLNYYVLYFFNYLTTYKITLLIFPSIYVNNDFD